MFQRKSVKLKKLSMTPALPTRLISNNSIQVRPQVAC